MVVDLEKFFRKYDLQELYGNLDPKMSEILKGFEINALDQSKGNRLVKHINKLGKGLPPENSLRILLLSNEFYVRFQAEKNIKSLQTRTKKISFLKFKKAIETLKTLNPDPSRFDEQYLLNLAEQNVAERKSALPSRDERLIHLIERMDGLGVELIKPIPKKKNPKGNDSINLFIYGVHDILKNHETTLRNYTICTRLASLLTILTGDKYIRQDIEGFLKRRSKTP